MDEVIVWLFYCCCKIWILTIFCTHETISHQHETVGTCARDLGRARVDLRCRQTEVRAVAVNSSAVVDSVRLSVWMINVQYHRVLKLKIWNAFKRREMFTSELAAWKLVSSGWLKAIKLHWEFGFLMIVCIYNYFSIS